MKHSFLGDSLEMKKQQQQQEQFYLIPSCSLRHSIIFLLFNVMDGDANKILI